MYPAPTGAVSCGTYTHVRWSGSTARSRSLQVVSVIFSSVVPRRCRITTRSSPLASSAASLMSDRTHGAWAWAMSSGPVDPAAAVAKSCPSTSRTPASTGSTPRRAQARSRNDIAGSTSTSTRSSASSSWTERSRTRGEPGTAYRTSPCSAAAATSAVDDLRVDVVVPLRRLVEVVEAGRRVDEVGAGVPRRAHVAMSGRGRSRRGSRRSRTLSSPGPSPTTVMVTRGRRPGRCPRPSGRSGGRR